MHQWFRLIFFLLAISVAVGCAQKPKPKAANSATTLHGRVAVTNFALLSILQSICEQPGDPVAEVVYVGPPEGADPHSWLPSTEQIRDLQKVDLIVCNGPGAVFAQWMDKVTIDEAKLLKTTDAIKLTEFVVVKDFQLVHSHGPEGEHSHSWVVAQCWLSPRIARKQAKLCYERMVDVYGNQKSLENGFAEVQKKFDSLQAIQEELALAHRGRVVVSSTPEVQYLTRDLGWSDRYLQWTEDRSTATAKTELADMRARYASADDEEKSKSAAVANLDVEELFLWSGSPLESISEFVNATWAKSVSVDLITTPSPSGSDYFSRMGDNLKRIGAVLK